MPNQHIKPEDRSPALQRYYDRKGTPEGDAAAKRQRELDAKRRADPEMKKHIAATHRVWYEEGGGKEKREEQYKKVKANGWLKKRRDDRQAVLVEHMGGVCSHPNCNETKNLQFDHIDPMTKSHNINRQDSYEKSFEELKKCQLLCPKHHLEKTFINDLPVIMEKKYGSE